MRRLAPLAFAFVMAAITVGHADALSPPPPPVKPPQFVPPAPLRIWSPQARIPIRLDKVDISAEVTGHVVRTRVELVLRNPNDQVLEGELQFPLRDGQVVTGFALDMGNELRAAVPVDKARGQQVFEDVTRTRVDPALLEATQGNNYKLRVYPIPGRGTRRVVLNLSQSLTRHTRGALQDGRLELPLQFADRVGQLAVDVRVSDVAASALQVDATGIAAQDVSTRQRDGWSQVQIHRINHQGAASLRVDVPSRTDAVVFTHVAEARTTFYAEVPLVQRSSPRSAPRTVAILWDASGSGARREHDRELALLDAYFKALRQVEVQLTVVRDTAEAPRRFAVKDGRWDELRNTLSHVAYDGATNFGALAAAQTADLALLFSDGLGNWGAAATPSDKTPTYAVGAASSVDAQRLIALSQRSGGDWLDLTSINVADALKSLQTRRARLIGVQGEGASQVVARMPQAGEPYLSLAGVLNRPQASVRLEFAQPDGRITMQSVAIVSRGPVVRRDADAAGADLVPMQWARMRIDELEEDHDAHRAEMRRIGREFGLVTRETSLIVLDAVRDYARYEIEPPMSLRPEYERLLAQQGRQLQATRSAHLEDVVRRFAEQTAWWQRDFPKSDVARIDEVAPVATGGAAAGVLRERQATLSSAENKAQVQAPARPDAVPTPAAPAPMVARSEAMLDSARRDSDKLAKSSAEQAPAEAAIQLTKWAPDSAYARRLREAPRDLVYQRYLDERPDFVNSTAFFLDAADILFDKGQPELGLRVLSNLAEMDLENRHILRVLGYRLLQARQPALAIRVFQSAQGLSPDEPQSYRDLGLAYADAQQWQESVDQLWEVVARPWNGRFPDIDLTSLADLNAIAARAQQQGKPVRTQAFDQRLMRNLPLDIRIVLSWDADNTDIDLWVIDPNGEKAYYGHRLTYQGGRMSQDVTGGYGPEEFALRRAKPGHYTVQAQFYGHRQQIVAPATTLMMRLSTGFGTAAQKEELVTLRLAGQSDMVTVGGFDVAP